MSLLRSVRKFFGLPVKADVVPNTAQKVPHREANHYIRVEINDEPHLFTTNQVRVARKRAKRNPEDC